VCEVDGSGVQGWTEVLVLERRSAVGSWVSRWGTDELGGMRERGVGRG